MQTSPPAQAGPQLPPHPLSPHTRLLQSGVQSTTHLSVRVLQTWAPGQLSHTLPQESYPQTVPPHPGTHAWHAPAAQFCWLGQLPQGPPQPSLVSPHSVPAQLGMHRQLPSKPHTSLPLHSPQLPPQPSSPQLSPSQLGAQTHCPAASQPSPGPQLPHTPPQPSGPQATPRQSGWQPSATHNPALPHISPALQVPHTPPQASGPQALPAQTGAQAPSPPRLSRYWPRRAASQSDSGAPGGMARSSTTRTRIRA
jgi:hypothetical protein